MATEPEPEKVNEVTVAPLKLVAMPAQVTALLTVMVVLAVVPLPAENSGKLPLLKGTREFVNAELVDQLAVVASQVPLVAALVPLLSHHRLVTAARAPGPEATRLEHEMSVNN